MIGRLTVALALLAFAGPALAGPGDTGGGPTPVNPGIPQERRIRDDVSGNPIVPTSDAPASMWIEGTVLSGSGAPMEGILVKLFSNGVVVASARTQGDGSFSTEANPPVGGNNTAVIWFESPDPEKMLDTHAVLHAGRVAHERELFPSCVPRVELAGNVARIDVKLLTEDERKEELERSRCLERDSG